MCYTGHMEKQTNIAQDGIDKCWCGCKYWQNSRCIDCNTQYRHTGFEAGAL